MQRGPLSKFPRFIFSIVDDLRTRRYRDCRRGANCLGKGWSRRTRANEASRLWRLGGRGDAAALACVVQ